MPLFKTKKQREAEKQAELSAKVTQMLKPPSKLDKAGRDLLPQSKRIRYGYRGYDPSREPMVDYETQRRGEEIKQRLKVTPEDLAKKVAAAKKKYASTQKKK